MLRREVGKSEVSAQSVELFVACLKARGVSREGFRHGVNLVGDESKCFRRDQFARLQKPPRVAESAKLQGEAQPIAIAPTPVNRLEIGASQGPVPDQRVQLGVGRANSSSSCAVVSARRLGMGGLSKIMIKETSTLASPP